MNLEIALKVVVFIATFGAQLWRRSFSLRFVKIVFVSSAVITLAFSIYYSFLQYHAWQANAVTKFFLPPYAKPDYFTSSVGYKFFVPWLIALLFAVVLPRIVEHLNKQYGERFFHDEEIWLMRLGIFLVGYPGFLFYIIFILAFGVLLSLVYSLFSWGRAPFYYLWMPLAAASIFVNMWLLPKGALIFFNL